MLGILKLFTGIILGVVCINFIKPPLLLIIVFSILGIISQIAYAHYLNRYLGGEDPVIKYRTRSLKQLRRLISIPIYIIVLNTLAVVFGYAALIAALETLNIIGRL